MSSQGEFSDFTPKGSESPTVRRTEAKKELKDKMNYLIESLQNLVVMARIVSGLGRNQRQKYMEEGNKEWLVGRTDLTKFLHALIQELKKFPNEAVNMVKTRRAVSISAGFMAPQRYQEEMLQFFRNARLGYAIDGNYLVLAHGRKCKDQQVLTNAVETSTPLNELLYFTQPTIGGQQNPLYGLMSPGTITILFLSLHTFFAGMKTGDTNTRLSASQEMRQYLPQIIQDTIQRDVDNVATELARNYGYNTPGYNKAAHDQAIAELTQLGTMAVQGIADPNLGANQRLVIFDGKVNREIFNPNYFPYAHLTKIATVGRVVLPKDIKSYTVEQLKAIPVNERTFKSLAATGELKQVEENAVRVYGKMEQFQGSTPETIISNVLNFQKQEASKVGLFKKLTQAEKKTPKKPRKSKK